MMKTRILIFLTLFGMVLGCKGKDGRNGIAGGAMQVIEGSISSDPEGVQIDPFDPKTSITVYYALQSSPSTYYELKGPVSLPSSDPYYSIVTSGASALVRLEHVQVGSLYRIQIWRAS